MMISRRQIVFALGAGTLAAPLKSFAQQQPTVRRIGFLAVRSRSTLSNPDVYYDAFLKGMRELGYVEGKNLAIEWRFASGSYERLSGLAVELVKLNPEVIVTHATPGVLALRDATATIPVVFAALADPLGIGLVPSLARPGANITGLSNISYDAHPKQLELLKTLLPGLSRVAVFANPGTAYSAAMVTAIRTTAGRIGVSVLPVEARTLEELERGFVGAVQAHAQAVLILADTFFVFQQTRIAELAVKSRLPTMFPFREAVEAGGLMSYGSNLLATYQHAATYVDKILKGAKPSDLPIEQPTQLELVINTKTAKAIGLRIPRMLLQRADRVIE